jgi:hypothetical protein
MPQPIWPDLPEGTIPYRPRLLLSKRPNHAAGIGAVACEWAALEGNFVHMLSFALFAFSKEGGYSLARTALETIESGTIRLEVIAALLRTRIPQDQFEIFDSEIRPEIRKCAGERNRVVHNSWCVHDDYPDHIIARYDDSYWKYSVKDFSDIAERIVQTTTRMTLFLGQFQRWDGVGPWNSISQPEPP